LEYLHQMYRPGFPEFPVPPEIEVRILDDLPGELPETLGESIRIMQARLVEREGTHDR
jgi:hypothetical protein